MHNRQMINRENFVRTISDYHVYPIYIIGLVFQASTTSVGTYLSLTLRSIGFTPFQTTLMGLPSTVGGLITMLAVTYSSQYFNERCLHGLFSQVWSLPTLIALTTFTKATPRWTKFAVTTVLISHPSTHAIQVAWTSRNSNSVRTRTVSSALYNIAVQISGIISNYIYRADDAPLYHRGNKSMIGICILNIVVYALVKAYYILVNRQRRKVWDSWTPEERDNYLATTTDRGNKRIDFQFAH